MAAVSRKLWACGPPTNRDPIVLAILGVLWGPRNGPNCDAYAAPVPPAPTAAEIASALSGDYAEGQVFYRLRLWTRRGLFVGVPCVGDTVDDPIVRFKINPRAAEVNVQNRWYLSPNAIVPVAQDINLCCFNPCVSKKGAVAGVDNCKFVQQPVLNAFQRQTLIARRDPADTPCGEINCRESATSIGLVRPERNQSLAQQEPLDPDNPLAQCSEG